MSVNFSASSNDSFIRPQFFILVNFGRCLIQRPSSFIYISFCITNALLFLPLSIFILYLVLQRCRQQSSASTTAMTSHSDIFTYHLVAMEMISVCGMIFCFCGVSGNNVAVLLVGFCLWSLAWYAEILFNSLTCVERYLAVVHPITYLSLRGERGIRARNISIGCVWLFSLVSGSQMILEGPVLVIDCCILFLSLAVSSFCSLSALCVLIRPGPGERGGDRKKVDQSKKRAFYTIVAIMGVLLLRFIWNLISVFSFGSVENSDCVILACGTWLNLPSCLILPLLFLYKEGLLACCKTNTK